MGSYRKAKRVTRGKRQPVHAHIHAARRAKERLGLDLTLTDLHDMCQQIRGGTAERLWRQSATRTFYRVQHAGQPLHVVYHHETKAILTVLTEAMATQTMERYG